MMIATWARSNLSMVTPSGMNSGSITEAMNRIETSGTPRTISMKTMAMTWIVGSLDERASAKSTPSTKPKASPTEESMKESGRPPQFVVLTTWRPKTPPYISTPQMTTTASQSQSRRRDQKRGIIE